MSSKIDLDKRIHPVVIIANNQSESPNMMPRPIALPDIVQASIPSVTQIITNSDEDTFLQVKEAEDEMELKRWEKKLGNRNFFFEFFDDNKSIECLYRDEKTNEIFYLIVNNFDTSRIENIDEVTLLKQVKLFLYVEDYNSESDFHSELDFDYAPMKLFLIPFLTENQVVDRIQKKHKTILSTFFYKAEGAKAVFFNSLEKLYKKNDLESITHFFSLSWADQSRRCLGVNHYDYKSHLFYPSFLFVTSDKKNLEDRNIVGSLINCALLLGKHDLVRECLEKNPLLKTSPDLLKRFSFIQEAISYGNLNGAADLLDQGLKAEKPFDDLFVMLQSINRAFEPKEEQAVFDFIDVLALKGYSPDYSLNTATKGELSLTLVEKCYFFTKKNPKFFRKIAFALIKNGAKISSRMATDMKRHVKRDPIYLEALEKQNLISLNEKAILLQEEKDPDISDLLQKSLESNNFLENKFKQGFLDPVVIPLKKIKELRLLKKELKKAYVLNSKNLIIKEQYLKLRSNYNLLKTNHFLLKELEAIREELKLSKVSNRLVAFYSLFSSTGSYDSEQSKERLGSLFFPGGKLFWNEMVNKILDVASAVQSDRFFLDHEITWCHGTKSVCLPLLTQIHALAPMGFLLQEGYVPLCGEVNASENGHNKSQISGSLFSKTWGDDNTYFNTSTRLLMCLMYASKIEGYKFNEMSFDPSRAWDRVTENFVNRLEAIKERHNGWSVVKVDILRLRSTDPEADKKLEGFKGLVLKKLEGHFSNEIKGHYQSLIDALQIKMSHHYSQADLELLKNPYPIVFASTNAVPHQLGVEFMFDGKAALGKDIQVAFTQEDKVAELKKALALYNVRVLSFESAFYLEMLQMAQGTRFKELEKAPFEVRVGKILQNDILPAYAHLLPEKPMYSKGGMLVPVPNPSFGLHVSSYEEYKKGVEELRMFPREFHGPTHAARVAIWTQALEPFFEVEDPFTTVLAGGAHDWRRQDEGVDRWENESAEAFQSYLLRLGYTPQETIPYIFALKNKDPKDHLFTANEQILIHDADVLEIMRCLRKDTDFKPEELCFYKRTDLPFDKDKFIAEVRKFIKFTEQPHVKAKVERSSNCHGELLRLIRESDEYPILKELLSHKIEGRKKGRRNLVS